MTYLLFLINVLGDNYRFEGVLIIHNSFQTLVTAQKNPIISPVIKMTFSLISFC